MTDYPTNSTAKPYFGTDDEPRTLWQMVRDEPEWAVSRITVGEEAIAQRDEYRHHLSVITEMTGNGDDIGAAHEGVNALVEDLARHKRMFVAACETLGEIQQALGNDIVGIEPVLVKELIEERDSLKAHAVAVAAAVGYDENSAYQFDASMQVHCINNVKGFAEQLHAIEREFFMVPGEPDEDYPDDEPEDECLVNSWGSTTEKYVEQFRAALARRDALQRAEELEQLAAELNECVEGEYFVDSILEKAQELLRQAEGHQ